MSTCVHVLLATAGEGRNIMAHQARAMGRASTPLIYTPSRSLRFTEGRAPSLAVGAARSNPPPPLTICYNVGRQTLQGGRTHRQRRSAGMGAGEGRGGGELALETRFRVTTRQN